MHPRNSVLGFQSEIRRAHCLIRMCLSAGTRVKYQMCFGKLTSQTFPLIRIQIQSILMSRTELLASTIHESDLFLLTFPPGDPMEFKTTLQLHGNKAIENLQFPGLHPVQWTHSYCIYGYLNMCVSVFTLTHFKGKID